MLEMVIHPDELLREQSHQVEDIDEKTVQLVKQMLSTLEDQRGLGLAAVQVGHLHRLFITNIAGDKPRVFINPSIIETAMELSDYNEGCLSIPGLYRDVRRPAAVKIQAWNERGRPYNLDAEGLLGRVVQHELDHLNGVLFFDHLDEEERSGALSEYEKLRSGGAKEGGSGGSSRRVRRRRLSSRTR